VSIGTSGVVSLVSTTPSADPTGTVAGFADATGHFLPLVATLNAARVLDATARLLGVDHAELSRLALSAPPGAGGLVLVPYLEGERTPDCPTRPAPSTASPSPRPTPLTWRAPPLRGCCADWPTGSTPSPPTAPGAGGSSWSVEEPAPRRFGRSRRLSSACRCSCRRPGSTSPTAPPGRPRGCWLAVTCLRPGRCQGSKCTRPTPLWASASGMPRSANSPRDDRPRPGEGRWRRRSTLDSCRPH
jgi:hypothetical protein